MYISWIVCLLFFLVCVQMYKAKRIPYSLITQYIYKFDL